MENSTYVKYFEDMIEYLKFCDLTVEQIENYYLQLVQAINNGLIKSPLRYLFTLLNAKVKPVLTRYDEETLNYIKTGLNHLTIQSLKDPNNSKMLDDYYRNEFGKMEQIAFLNIISFDTFIKYYNLIKMALCFPTKATDSVKIISLINLLFNINIKILTPKDREKLSQMKLDLEEKYYSLLNAEEYKPNII